MSYYAIKMDPNYLEHHGIKGQSWGHRNGPPYPLGYSDHSASEKAKNPKTKIGGTNEQPKERKKLTDKQKANIKKAVIIGAAAAGTALAVYGGTKLIKSKAMDKIVSEGLQKSEKLIKLANAKNMGGLGGIDKNYSLLRQAEEVRNNAIAKANATGKSTIKSLKELMTHLPTDLDGSANPLNLKNNCKDVAEATMKRWLGVDVSAVADKKTVVGNLHDFVEQRKYNKGGITWLGDSGSLSLKKDTDNVERVSKAILKAFNEGDCGMIGLDFAPEFLKDGTEERGHAFNWLISKGKVIFYDDQPEKTLTDASKHIRLADVSKEVEILRMTKQAFAK